MLALAGYHVITISLGEVNKRFSQSTAVMQSLVGECSRQQHRAFFFSTDLHAGRTTAESSALGGILDLLDI